ncbi:hypothetical protein F511_31532 [Dorcoceras hygrometricum]|uniref:Uncharacterized protein n=1 Tax=Dorcoceras hygrometricum TaxID=472368 RepID=A0A2Z7A817_9LAMI|nr:hypothetical protein F511_31532 [Dorcoceras hygrometricum]
MCARPAAFGWPLCAASAHGLSWLRMISKRWPAITQQLARPARGAAADRSRNRCTTQASAVQHRSRNMPGHRALGRSHARRRHGHRQRIFDSISKLKLDTIWHNNCIDQIRTLALIPLLGNHGGSGSRPRPDTRLLRQPALEGLTRSARTDSPRKIGRNNFRRTAAAAATSGGGGGVRREREEAPFALGLGFNCVMS